MKEFQKQYLKEDERDAQEKIDKRINKNEEQKKLIEDPWVIAPGGN